MKIGIDLGTSYSSVAVDVNGKIEMIKVSTGASAFGDSFSMPTAVYMDNGQMLLGQAAQNKRKVSPTCFKNEFKRDFGTTTPYIIGGEEYLPEQLYTELFKYFKDQAVKQMGEKVEAVYITHPANYGNNKKQLIEKAANNAGLFDVVLIDEPTAAAAGYAQKNKIINGDILLVYDLGGGTFDVALIKKTAKGYVHLTEPLGISNCGGVDFDRAIFDDIMRKMSQNGGFDVDRLIREKRFTAVLSEICVQIKHQLSQAQSHTEPIAVGPFDYFDFTITRQEFEELIYPYVVNTCEKIKNVLRNSGLVGSDIDRVLLVGGSSRIPLVKKIVQETLQKDISLDADPELAVCQGAVSLGLIQKNDVIDISEEEIQIQKTQQSKESAVLKNEAVESLERMHVHMNKVMFNSSASDGKWIYYSEDKDNNTLYRINIDGSQKTKLSDLSPVEGKIKIENEWIYYNVTVNDKMNGNIYKIRKDGSGETLISDEYNAGWYCDFVVKDGWIYFVNKYEVLKKKRIGDKCSIQLADDNDVTFIAIDKLWIYYTRMCSSSYKLCKIGIDGRNRMELCSLDNSGDRESMILRVVVFEDWIYYMKRITEKKSSKETIWSELWKISIDGSENNKILSDYGDDNNELVGFNVMNRQLYLITCKDDKTYNYRMKLGESNLQWVSFDVLRQEVENMLE